jgi:hypothetical protein
MSVEIFASDGVCFSVGIFLGLNSHCMYILVLFVSEMILLGLTGRMMSCVWLDPAEAKKPSPCTILPSTYSKVQPSTHAIGTSSNSGSLCEVC